MLSIFRDDDETNNLTIFSGYAVEAVKQYRILKQARRKLLKMKHEVTIQQNAYKLSAKIKEIKGIVSKSVWNSLLEKQVIVYIHNAGTLHWNCTFILNLKHYSTEWEHKMLTNDTVLKNDELSGYLTYDPMGHTTKYNELDVKSGVLDF